MTRTTEQQLLADALELEHSGKLSEALDAWGKMAEIATYPRLKEQLVKRVASIRQMKKEGYGL